MKNLIRLVLIFLTACAREDAFTVEGLIGVHVGRGDGAFDLLAEYRTRSAVSSLLARDVNGDGRVDLLAGGDGVEILIGAGDGTFRSGERYLSGRYSVTGLASGDLDLDGIPDFVNSDRETMAVFLGNGDGTFRAAGQYREGDYISVEIGDFTQDGVPDVVAIAMTGSSLSLFRGLGDGSLAAPTVFDVGGLATRIAAGDFERDGTPDVAVTSSYEGRGVLNVFRSDGGSAFSKRDAYELGNILPTFIAAADLGGSTALAIAGASGDAPILISGRPDGTFEPVRSLGSGSSTPATLAFQDLDLDGRPDLVAADSARPLLRTYLGIGDRSFTDPTEYWLTKAAGTIAVGDVDGDGMADLVTGGAPSTAF